MGTAEKGGGAETESRPEVPGAPEPGAVRRPQRRGLDRRRQIIDAALALFSVRGTRGTSIADVAAAADLSAQGVLYHFGTKEALIAEVVVELESRREADIVATVGDGGVGMLRRLAEVGAHVAEARALAALNVAVAAENMDATDPHHELFAERRRHDQRALEAGLARGVARGEFRADLDIARTAEEMGALMAGAWLNWLLEPGGSDVARIYRHYFGELEARIACAGRDR